MRELLCQAFCDDLKVTVVPDGLAVSTTFRREDGDAIGFYVIEDSETPGRFRLEDDGETVPYLEACGVDLSADARSEAFESLLRMHEASYDASEGIIFTKYYSENDIPSAAMKFVSVLLRARDFLLLTPERVATTFREDAASAIVRRFEGKADVALNEPLDQRLIKYPADVVIRQGQRTPLVIYLGTSEVKALDAIVLRMETAKYTLVPCKVALLLDEVGRHGIRDISLSRAMNHLDYVGAFRGFEEDALERLEREFFGDRPPATAH